MKKWKRLEETLLIKTPIFEFKSIKLLHAEKHSLHNFYIIDSKDWVNIIPITANNEIILINQYRAGTNEITIEVPGGIIDDSENDPIITAKRELEEETGYIGKKYYTIGQVMPNPAFITNKCFFVVAEDVEPIGKENFDESEYIESFKVPMEKISEMIKNREITHAITLNAFLYLHLNQVRGFKLL